MERKSRIFEQLPESSERSKSDMKYSTQLNRFFLTPIGIWPTNSNGIIKENISEFLIILSSSLLCFLVVPCILHTVIEEKNPAVKMKMIGPSIFAIMSISKYFFLILRRKEIKNCLEHIDIDWRKVEFVDDRQVMLGCAKLGRSIVLSCTVFMCGGGFFYDTIMPIAIGNYITPDNITIRPFIYAVYNPLFSAQTTPNYEIVFAIQWLAGCVTWFVTVGACSLAAVFVLHTCGQLRIVMSRLKNLPNESIGNEIIMENQMTEIIQIHSNALEFLTRIEAALNEVYFFEFFGCILNLCFLGFYFMTEFAQSDAISTTTYCVLLVSMTFNIFILCYIGEMLTQHGDDISTAAYMIDWYELPLKSARKLTLLLLKANHPPKITAGKMSELTFRSFSTAMRTSVAYLNFLRTFGLQ